MSKKRPVCPSRFFVHCTSCAVRPIHTRPVVFPRLGQTARGRDEKSDDYAEQRIQIALVSRLVSSSCSCLAKFLRSPPSSSIPQVPVVNRVIFPSCLRPTHPLNTSSSGGTLKISQLQLNYRAPTAVRVIYLLELIREKPTMIKLVTQYARRRIIHQPPFPFNLPPSFTILPF